MIKPISYAKNFQPAPFKPTPISVTANTGDLQDPMMKIRRVTLIVRSLFAR